MVTRRHQLSVIDGVDQILLVINLGNQFTYDSNRLCWQIVAVLFIGWMQLLLYSNSIKALEADRVVAGDSK